MAYLPFEPPHVGELVYRTYIEPFENVTTTTIALALKIDPEMFSNFLNGKIDLTPELAIKLSEVLGGSVQQWLNIQKSYDQYYNPKKSV
jgi:addiction module HigA family antidote